MKQITVVSGKGGTGKTVLSASFAVLAGGAVAVDCDVDAADLHLLLHPRVQSTHQFVSGRTARIDPGRCTGCGACLEACRFGAVRGDYTIDPLACEGCGLCSRLCPCEAVIMEENHCGEWYVSDTAYGPMVHARLGIGEENSGKLVSRIKEAARGIAGAEKLDYLIVDGPPGIGCPVFAALAGSDLAVVVTEPTLSGIHDMERVIGVARHFGIPSVVVINKYDLDEENERSIERFCVREEVTVAGKIPFSRTVNESIVGAVPVVEYTDTGVTVEIRGIWRCISRNGGETGDAGDA